MTIGELVWNAASSSLVLAKNLTALVVASRFTTSTVDAVCHEGLEQATGAAQRSGWVPSKFGTGPN